MTTKQDRRIAKAAEAEARFAEIMKASIRITEERAAARDWGDKPEDMTSGEWEAAKAVRVLREGGLAWWDLAHTLGLPGSGPSVATGKTGASYARRLYERAFGDRPRGHRASSVGSAERRAEAAGPWFGADKTVEEVCLEVAGQEVTWQVRPAEGIQFTDSAVVSPKGASAYRDNAITFHTVVFGAPEKGKGSIWMRGPERTVKIANIIRVAPGIPAGERVF